MRLRDVDRCFLSPLCIARVLFYHRTYTPPSRAFLAGVHSCAVWARMQYISPRFRGFLCILHKNTCQKPIKFVKYFLKLWFFGFQPQYVVDFDPFYPIKSPTSCGFTQFAFGSKWCYTVLAQSKTAPQHQPAVRRVHPPAPLVCTLPSKQRPVKAAHLHSKRTAPLTAGGSSKPAQHSAHTKAQFIASAFQNRRWRTRAKLKGRYWCTLKSKHRTARIQLHHRVTVVLPAPAV